MSNATATEKKKLEGVCALWRHKSKSGKGYYFSGSTEDRKTMLTGFYNTEKKNLKEPDIRVYVRDQEGKLSPEPFVSLWCNSTKKGKKILSGKIDGKKVVGFINEKGSEKAPYISIYWSDDEPQEAEAPKTEEKPKSTRKAKQKEEPEFEAMTDEDLEASLPF